MTEGTHVLSRVPTTVFLVLGVTRDRAYHYGMVGCGLQVDDSGEFDWAQTTVTLSPDKEEVLLFLKVRGIEYSLVPSDRKPIRVSILDFEDYMRRFASIQEFLELYRRYRYLRLGPKGFGSPWELDSREAFLIRMESNEFNRYFVTDPRGQLTYSEIARRVSRHAPTMLAVPPGLPDPGKGGWI